MASDFLGGILGSLGGNSLTGLFFILIIGVFTILICAGILFYFLKKRKSWNIDVEFKIPRSLKQNKDRELDGSTQAEWGKGAYDSRSGVVWLKRKGVKKVPMKPFDVKRFLQGKKILTVVQVGIEDYKPVLPESYIMMEDENGVEAALVKIRIDTTSSKAWRNTFEREAKSTYSITNWLRENAMYVGIGLILIMNFVGFAILWSQVKP